MQRKSSNKRSTLWLWLWLWLVVAVLVVVADQYVKLLVVGYYRLGEQTYVTSFFNVVRAHNTGAAFSFLANAGGWQHWLFVALAIAACIFIVGLLRAHASQKLFAFSLSMVLGGAIGNVTDRLQHGYVVDFLDFHWNWLRPVFYHGHFPTFNIADAAITIGTIGIILDELRRVRRGSR